MKISCKSYLLLYYRHIILSSQLTRLFRPGVGQGQRWLRESLYDYAGVQFGLFSRFDFSGNLSFYWRQLTVYLWLDACLSSWVGNFAGRRKGMVELEAKGLREGVFGGGHKNRGLESQRGGPSIIRLRSPCTNPVDLIPL